MAPYKDDINFLRNKQVTWTEIAKYLGEKFGVKTSSENIRQFYLRQRLSSDIAQKSVEKTSISNMKKLFENFKMKD